MLVDPFPSRWSPVCLLSWFIRRFTRTYRDLQYMWYRCGAQCGLIPKDPLVAIGWLLVSPIQTFNACIFSYVLPCFPTKTIAPMVGVDPPPLGSKLVSRPPVIIWPGFMQLLAAREELRCQYAGSCYVTASWKGHWGWLGKIYPIDDRYIYIDSIYIYRVHICTYVRMYVCMYVCLYVCLCV